MKYTNRHGLLWSWVERVQTSPDLRKTPPEPPSRGIPVGARILHDHRHRELLNSYRL